MKSLMKSLIPSVDEELDVFIVWPVEWGQGPGG
jgi:hypothetical protein